MYLCLDCKSNNVVEVDTVQAYFREGEWTRLRTVTVHENLNHGVKGFMSACPELSMTATAIGDTELESILALGEILRGMLGVELLGKTIDE